MEEGRGEKEREGERRRGERGEKERREGRGERRRGERGEGRGKGKRVVYKPLVNLDANFFLIP